MSDDVQVRRYLRDVRSELRLPRHRRRRAIEEIRGHLDDSAVAHVDGGALREQAVALAIHEMGPPDVVAAQFNDDELAGSDVAGARRWLPAVPSLVLFVVAAGLLASSVRWIADGWTVGERAAQERFLWAAVIAGILTSAAFISIRRAQRDAAWRTGAWLCPGLALAAAGLGLF